MNNAIDFLEKAINSPHEFLGVNEFASLDLAVEFLCKTKDKNNKRVVDLTLDGLYEQISDTMLLKYDSKNPIFIDINKLLSSSWEKEVTKKLIELYISNHNRDFIDSFLNVLIFKKENDSQYLASEKLVDYFDQNIEKLSDVEKIIYCIHSINVSYFYHQGNYKFNHSAFAKYIYYNLLGLTFEQSKAVKRIAIWALFWVVGGFTKSKSLIKINSKFLTLIYSLLGKKFDLKTNLRLSVILIKSNNKIAHQIGSNLTESWTRNIYDGRIEKRKSKPIEFHYSTTIENVFLKALNLSDKLWINEIIIPYLGLTANERVIAKLSDNLKSGDLLKLKSAIVLSGIGVLSDEQIELYNIRKAEIFDEVIKSNSDLCYQVMAKDTTDRVAWYFILVDRQKKDHFLAHKPGDSYDLADYGSIVASGYGEAVPDDVKKMLKEKYGFDNF